ncbi:secreted protein acidic and cysteine rich [Phyllostomus discolor]|uniref:SPARC n=1 Tax=Phyllostomus discolor TaxID=89673 RepID=A0A833YV12_9CHIR|nr:secreted protein acidic and cysteine rich [Phyllostomus discolor]
MKAWIFFLLCLAGRALAAPQQEALPDETEVVEETVAEVSEVPVGANPVQVEVGEFEEGAEEAEEEVVAENPCQNHHCKHGKVCELDENNTPMCVCQDPTSCPAPIGEFEKVCSNDNKTFDSSCHFFATKCTLEGTKKGHKLHLDYIGPCKFLPPPPFSFLSINQEKLRSQWDGQISQAENSFTSKHFMKKLLLINHAGSHHVVASLTNLSK